MYSWLELADCRLFNITENGSWTGLEGSVSAALFTGE